MGIKGLTKLLGDNAPNCIKEDEIKHYFGRKVAMDASMSIYQVRCSKSLIKFMIAVMRMDGSNTSSGLTDENGETTSHLQGLFYRTIRMLSHGIKPCYVFDGKPPELKSGELAKRREKREKAEEERQEAKEIGDQDALTRFTKRTVRVTPQHNAEAQKLLRLMGVPVIQAPCEAEAQCAAMAAAGLVYATGTEDMDALTLGTPILLRNLTVSEAQKLPIKEINLQSALDELKLTKAQFIDLCILLGCDYCDSIRGIGPVRALDMIRKYGNIEGIIKNLDTNKYKIPESFDYVKVRELFNNPEVTDPKELELKWEDPDEDGLIQFLVHEKGFSEERIRNGIEKLKKTRTTSVQNRLTSYFGSPVIVKRKLEEKFDPKAKKSKLNPVRGKGSPAKAKSSPRRGR